MKKWQLWSYGEVLRTVDDLSPRLASWDRHDHPSQVRLRAYLDNLMDGLQPLPVRPAALFLHLDIDVGDPRNLLHHHDLENYLTPLFGQRYLDPSRFLLVSATKHVGNGSRLSIGTVMAGTGLPQGDGWHHFSHAAGSGSEAKRWKEGLRSALARAGARQLPPGPVEVHLAWRCSPIRNWTNLWKPTGDTMGPVLGETRRRGFDPADDRIVVLGLHVNPDPEMVYEVDVGMWWRSRGS